MGPVAEVDTITFPSLGAIEINERTLAIAAEQLRRIPGVVAVAGGES